MAAAVAAGKPRPGAGSAANSVFAPASLGRLHPRKPAIRAGTSEPPMAAKKKTASKAQETTLRHLWLAGLGLVAVARREASTAANDAASRVESL